MKPTTLIYFQISNDHKDDFLSAGFIEIFNPTITAIDIIISVILFKASALTVAESKQISNIFRNR